MENILDLVNKRDQLTRDLKNIRKGLTDQVKETRIYKTVLDNTLKTCKDEKVAASHALKVALETIISEATAN
jgi:hypothetical protein